MIEIDDDVREVVEYLCALCLVYAGVRITKRLIDGYLDNLCSTQEGFEKAYSLGIARPGIDFVDVGQE